MPSKEYGTASIQISIIAILLIIFFSILRASLSRRMNKVKINNIIRIVAKASIAEFRNSNGVPTINQVVKNDNPRNIMIKFFFTANVFCFLISVVFFSSLEICEELSAKQK